MIFRMKVVLCRLVPADSFIAMDDFPGPRSLAAHLVALMDDPDRYVARFRWRQAGWAFTPRNAPGHRTGG
jgi:hypothetical protein